MWPKQPCACLPIPTPHLRGDDTPPAKTNPLTRKHLDDFVASYKPGQPRSERVETEQFKSFSYDELMARDKANLDIIWLRGETLDDLDNLPHPEIIAQEIVEDLTAALAEFEAVASALEASQSSTATIVTAG